jgi:hypothetical protein
MENFNYNKHGRKFILEIVDGKEHYKAADGNYKLICDIGFGWERALKIINSRPVTKVVEITNEQVNSSEN